MEQKIFDGRNAAYKVAEFNGLTKVTTDHYFMEEADVLDFYEKFSPVAEKSKGTLTIFNRQGRNWVKWSIKDVEFMAETKNYFSEQDSRDDEFIKDYITSNYGVSDFGEDDSIADLIKGCIEGLLKTYGFLDDERNARIFMEYPQFKKELNESLDWAFQEYLNITDWADYLSLNA